MSRISQFVAIHAHFRIDPSHRETVGRLIGELELRASENPLVLFHEASFRSEDLALRIAFPSAEPLLDHLAGTSEWFERLLTGTELLRIEVHGPEQELAVLRGPLGVFMPEWYVLTAPRS